MHWIASLQAVSINHGLADIGASLGQQRRKQIENHSGLCAGLHPEFSGNRASAPRSPPAIRL